jgi:hypothetical protein
VDLPLLEENQEDYESRDTEPTREDLLEMQAGRAETPSLSEDTDKLNNCPFEIHERPALNKMPFWSKKKCFFNSKYLFFLFLFAINSQNNWRIHLKKKKGNNLQGNCS